MGNDVLPDFSGRLASYQPATILAIGPRAGALTSDYHEAHPDCRMSYLDAEGTLGADSLLGELAGHGRFDFAILRGVLERADADTGAHRAGALARRTRQALLFGIRSRATVITRGNTSALIAMGLAHWSRETVNAAVLEIYGFDLGTYKATPDWLNARHWAHPQQWGKQRW